MSLPKILESKTKIRFQDCDPFNHLNNASYFNYLINAREDQLIENYDLDIYNHAITTGKSWVVSFHQIAYLKPANLMEEVTIDSQLIAYNEKTLRVEIRMWNNTKTKLKAILWSSFTYFNIVKQQSEEHSEKLINLFKEVILPIDETNFEERLKSLRPQK
ncbi:MAG: acyl-CoA thioesterase [Flavobacteriaceae bacterium]|nr:acyl-CoA thioesterase [Flavobacteriaceae bacterium]